MIRLRNLNFETGQLLIHLKMWKFQKCSGGFHFLDYSVNGRLYWESVIHLSYAFSFPTSVEIAMQCIAKVFFF
jgi:hypothetical protein